MKKWSYMLIIAGGILWGMIGVFVQGLSELGFSVMQIVFLRTATAAVILVVYVLIKDKGLLKISLRDSVYFIGTGIVGIVFFSWCYFTAIKETSLAVAAILLYTAPAFVTLLSRILFKEWITKRKLLSLALTFIGTALVIGYFPYTDSSSISYFGLLVGIGSGVGYALYSIFGKAALQKYHTLTVTTYTFIFAAFFMLPLGGVWRDTHLFTNHTNWLYIIGLGLLPTVLAYVFYTKGLSYIESSRAAIAATIEPVVATLVGVLVFQESWTPWQMLGMVFVLTAVVVVQENYKTPGD